MEKLTIAQNTLMKVSKQALAMLGCLRSMSGSPLATAAQKTLPNQLRKTRASESALENMVILGTDEDGSPITCDVAPMEFDR